MRYTVVWKKSVQDELADLWLSAPNRNAVTVATNVIDERLKNDAAMEGIPVSEGLRAFIAPPLRILFAVSEPDRVVEVLRVRWL